MTELARLAGLPPSNVHRTLQTWANLGFAAQDRESGLYNCTLRVFEWGPRVADGFDVRRAAREPLRRLARQTQETIHPSLLDGSEIVYLEKIASPQPVRADSTVGCRATVHCVATGEVLLACAGSEALAQLSVPLRRPTRHTVADLCALERQIEQVARNGYAVNREEWRLGVSGLGAAVYDQCGQEIAAAGLSAPTARLDDNRNHTLGLALATTASEITRAFGGRVPIETAVPTSPKHLERQHR